jgi:hypothetical protein
MRSVSPIYARLRSAQRINGPRAGGKNPGISSLRLFNQRGLKSIVEWEDQLSEKDYSAICLDFHLSMSDSVEITGPNLLAH